MNTRKSSNKNKWGDNIVNPLKSYLIPHEGNNHRPLLLRPTALKIYLIILIFTKLIVTSYLFVSYPSEGYFASITSGSILNLTNSSRKQNKLPELKTSTLLNQAAYRKAQDMLARNYFSHTSPNGTRFWDWIKKAGYSYTTAGENLAMDFTSAQTVHQALMASPSHKKNILNAEYKEIGISVVSGKINGKDTMLLVEFFGKPKVVLASTSPNQTTPSNQTTSNTNQSPSASPDNQPQITKPSPYYKAEVVGLSNQTLNITTREKIDFWVDIKNTGTINWVSTGDNFIALNATDPAGRASHFQDDTWINAYRPTKLTKDNILPNETARFNFTLKAPSLAGDYQESFQLVAENLTWIEGSYFSIPITVTKPAFAIANSNINQNINSNENLNTNLNKEIYVVAETNTNQLILGEVTKQIIAGTDDIKQTKSLVDYMILYSDWIFWTLLIFVTTILLLNIFIKIRIQHLNLIIPSIMVIILAALMIVTRFHFIEHFVSQPIIL